MRKVTEESTKSTVDQLLEAVIFSIIYRIHHKKTKCLSVIIICVFLKLNKNKMQTVIKYGVVGFSRNQFDKKTAREILREEFQSIHEKYPKTTIEIVSGYTNSGVPKIAYQLADIFGFVTVGFSAQQALRVRSGVYPVQKKIIKGNKFGDESEAFIAYIDALIRVGGGKQSRHETELFKKRHSEKGIDGILSEFEVDWYGK
jgi:hypothetical protein